MDPLVVLWQSAAGRRDTWNSGVFGSRYASNFQEIIGNIRELLSLKVFFKSIS
jgi:hypothetical protein